MVREDLKTIRASLHKIKELLEPAQIPWAVFSGVAAYLYGSKRKITDVDILVRKQDLERTKKILRLLRNIDVIADLVIPTEKGEYHFFMDEEMIKKLKWKRLLGLAVPVIPVEDNIIFKALLQRQEKNGKQDITDIQNMINEANLDLKYLKKRIETYRAEKRVYPLLKSFGIIYEK